MTLSETLSLALTAGALLLAVPGALVSLRQLRPAGVARRQAPRGVLVAKLALFAYVAVMFALALFYAFGDPRLESSIVYGTLAGLAVLLAQLLRPGAPGWWLAAVTFTALNIPFVVMLGLGSLVEEAAVVPTVVLTCLLFAAAVTATVALMSPAARGYLRRRAG